jgi:hypothetical protein
MRAGKPLKRLASIFEKVMGLKAGVNETYGQCNKPNEKITGQARCVRARRRFASRFA